MLATRRAHVYACLCSVRGNGVAVVASYTKFVTVVLKHSQHLCVCSRSCCRHTGTGVLTLRLLAPTVRTCCQGGRKGKPVTKGGCKNHHSHVVVLRCWRPRSATACEAEVVRTLSGKVVEVHAKQHMCNASRQAGAKASTRAIRLGMMQGIALDTCTPGRPWG